MASKAYFDYDDMVAAAEKAAGSSDWGPDDPLPLLRVLVKSLNEESNLSEEGRARAKGFMHDILTGRLQIVADHKKYPEIPKQKIEKPIFLTGSQRAGTSYLNAVLAHDPKNLGVWEWQLHVPSPPANHPQFNHEPDIIRGEHIMETQGFMDPFLRKMHDYDARKPAEDSFAQCYSLISVTYPFFFGVPSYGAHIAGMDNTPAYKIEKMFLQSLQWGITGRQWVLKSPLHLGMLGEMFAVFPDSLVVVNHRDPTRTLSSLMSLLVAHRRQFGSPVTVDRPFALGMMEGIAAGYEDMMRRRKDPKVNAVFVDVNYVDLERDALSQAKKIYDHFGMELNESSKAAMAKYIAENRKGKHGAHRHSLEESGLKVEEVRERFKTYLDAYDVPREQAV
jgi:hypothetical protein